MDTNDNVLEGPDYDDKNNSGMNEVGLEDLVSDEDDD